MRLIAFLVAVAGGFLVNILLLPEPRIHNQILAVIGWGLVVCVMPAPPMTRATLRGILPLLGAIAIVVLACAGSWLFGEYPKSLALPTLGLLAAASLLVAHGASWGATSAAEAFKPLALALVITGLIGSVIAVVQITLPDLADGTFYSGTTLPGRAAGNIGQPNIFADSLLWALVALLPLAAAHAGPKVMKAAVMGAGALLLLATVLTGSRAAYLNIVVLALWGVGYRGWPKPWGRVLPCLPIVALLLWAVVRACGTWGGVAAGELHHATGDLSSSRWDVWHDALAMIIANPWTGVGWGQFNFVWSLSPVTARDGNLIGNAHDLALQLAAELGLPCAALVLSLLGYAAWRSLRGLNRSRGPDSIAATAACMIVGVIGAHSFLEFPLWWAVILLPTAWSWGLAIGAAMSRESGLAEATDTPVASMSGLSGNAPVGASESRRRWRMAGLLLLMGGLSAWFDYRNVTAIYLPAPDAPPLLQRLHSGQASPLFARYADHSLALSIRPSVAALPEIERSAHVLLDMQTMFIWANALQQHGDVDKARYLAQRMREFQRAETDGFFARCTDPAAAATLFQCQAPTVPLTWRDFR